MMQRRTVFFCLMAMLLWFQVGCDWREAYREHLNAGRAFMAESKYAQARAAFALALTCNPYGFAANLAYAQCLSIVPDAGDDALAALRRCEQLDFPKNAKGVAWRKDQITAFEHIASGEWEDPVDAVREFLAVTWRGDVPHLFMRVDNNMFVGLMQQKMEPDDIPAHFRNFFSGVQKYSILSRTMQGQHAFVHLKMEEARGKIKSVHILLTVHPDGFWQISSVTDKKSERS